MRKEGRGGQERVGKVFQKRKREKEKGREKRNKIRVAPTETEKSHLSAAVTWSSASSPLDVGDSPVLNSSIPWEWSRLSSFPSITTCWKWIRLASPAPTRLGDEQEKN